MALPTFVAKGAEGVATVAFGVAFPAGIAADDILVLYAMGDTGQSHFISNSHGGTWTQVANSVQDVSSGGVGVSQAIWWARYDGTNPSGVDLGDSGNFMMGCVAAYRGCVTTGDPWNTTAGGTETTADTSISIPGSTTTENDCLVCFLISHGVDTTIQQVTGTTWANSDLSDILHPTDGNRFARTTNAGNGGGMAGGDGGKAVAGTYGNTTATMLNNSNKCLWSGALRSANPTPLFIPKIVATVNA